MFPMKYLFYFIVLRQILSTPHINLYNTNWISEIVGIQQNCLRVAASVEKAYINREIISYCMDELPSKFDIEKNDLFPKFTFDELSKKNITSEQLYLWSAPIDLIENYQFYLNELLLTSSNNLSLANEVFYNCTLPRFGSQCEYEFDYYHPNHSSLYHIIRDFYRTYEYEPTELTCYIHLQCNRGPFPSCLDWSEICDGKIDCQDGGFDEEYCWQLEINECEENEYRCMNGQCIPESFAKEVDYNYECLDQSDFPNAYDMIQNRLTRSEPSFGYEDIACTRIGLTSSCLEQRRKLLIYAIFSIKDKNLSDFCWLAFKCGTFSMDILDNEICNEFDKDTNFLKIVNETCPDIMFIPAIPVLFNDIYFVHTKHRPQFSFGKRLFPLYRCYNNSRYDNMFIDHSKVILNNLTCHLNDYTFVTSSSRNWLWEDLELLYNEVKHYALVWNYTSEICNKSNMYQCINSSKCISIYRLLNGIHDCPHKDDEDINKINITHGIKQMKRYYFQCLLSNESISQSMVMNGQCNCLEIERDWCEDEDPELYDIKGKISFESICDGFTELYPILVDGRNETDETECERWSCNNIYTHCDGTWNCPDGRDETGCYISTILNCSSNEHICVSYHTNQFMCLSLTKVNDGIVDCLGAFDELNLCQKMSKSIIKMDFSCMPNQSKCINFATLCNKKADCINGDDERLCNINSSILTNDIIISSSDTSVRLNPLDFIRKKVRTPIQKGVKLFSLDGFTVSMDDETYYTLDNKFPMSSLINNFEEKKVQCHRGLDVRIRLKNEINSTTKKSVCFCPPSYYGSQCQYQNQRISLAIQFQASSHSWQTIFAIIISLIDDQRIIHSYQQFSYLSARDCHSKLNIYLLYSTRPKNKSKNYAIHIDIYEKISLGYRSSLLIPIKFPFLPVHRLAFIINIPRNNNTIQSYSKHKCIHGKCIKYSNNKLNETFCQCYRGWSGKYCTIRHNCICSLDSLCIGVDINNQSVCICPIYRFGPRCLIIDRTCTNNINSTCKNGGQCIPNDEYIESDQKFRCICPRGFTGKRCEIIENQIIISFDKNIILSQSIFIHFILIGRSTKPLKATTFRTIISKHNSVNIFWSEPFHIVFIEIPPKNYYLTVIQNIYIRSTIINKTINLLDRCLNLNELFNNSIIKLDLIRRIKYYHLPCQNSSLNLSCFYDNIYICLCENYFEQRVANCFQFDHDEKFDCLNQNDCENNGQCFRDSSECPVKSICMCPVCFYGIKCQFNTNGFGLSLDAILGYHISSKLNFNKQSIIIKISLGLTIILIITGLINSIFSIITFKNKIVHEVGCGLYLLISSITTLFLTIIFGIKFLILILSQMNIIENKSFLSFQCYSIDFILRICLCMDQWLNACVAIERTFMIIKTVNFNKKKSKKIAKYTIIILIIIIIGSSIHDPIYRRLIEEEDDDEKRTWCIVIYPNKLQIFDSFIHSFHVLAPFFINFICAIILITKKSHQQAIIQTRRTFRELLKEQLREHKHILVAPIVLVIFALPRVIIAFAVKCMKSIDDSWIFLCGYFLSFIPSMLTFFVFILPSTFYKKEFRQTMVQYRVRIQRRLHFN